MNFIRRPAKFAVEADQVVTQAGDVLARRLDFIPPPAKPLPCSLDPTAMGRDPRQRGRDLSLGVDEDLGPQHDRVHQRAHGPDAGRVHEAALGRRPAPSLGKGIPHRRPIQDQRAMHARRHRCLRRCAAVLAEGSERRLQVLLDRLDERGVEMTAPLHRLHLRPVESSLWKGDRGSLFSSVAELARELPCAEVARQEGADLRQQFVDQPRRQRLRLVDQDELLALRLEIGRRRTQRPARGSCCSSRAPAPGNAADHRRSRQRAGPRAGSGMLVACRCRRHPSCPPAGSRGRF